MKKWRMVLITMGWLFALFQLMGYIGTIASNEINTIETNIPFLIGFNFFIILAVIFFVIANRLKRKIRREKEKAEIDSLLNNGEH